MVKSIGMVKKENPRQNYYLVKKLLFHGKENSSELNVTHELTF